MKLTYPRGHAYTNIMKHQMNRLLIFNTLVTQRLLGVSMHKAHFETKKIMAINPEAGRRYYSGRVTRNMYRMTIFRGLNPIMYIPARIIVPKKVVKKYRNKYGKN